ncbi:MAG: MarR family transcriptional regulator [Pseudomonadota bacterium]
MDLTSPPDCPYYLVYRVSLAVTSALKKGLADAGVGNLKPAYLGVLLALWFQDRLRAVELCKKAGLEPSSMTGLLDRMERDGLVKRTPDPDDRRAIQIHLTPEGTAAMKPANAAVTAVLDSVFAGIPDADIETTKQVLRTVLLNCSQEEA